VSLRALAKAEFQAQLARKWLSGSWLCLEQPFGWLTWVLQGACDARGGIANFTITSIPVPTLWPF